VNIDGVYESENKEGFGEHGAGTADGTSQEEMGDRKSTAEDERMPGPRGDQGEFRLSEEGLDYDSFLSAYRKSESGIIKSLVDVTRACNSRAGAIFMFTPSGLRATYALGIGEGCVNELEVGKNTEFYRKAFAHNHALFLHRSISDFEPFDFICQDGELAQLGRCDFLPVTLRSSSAYLLLNVPSNINDTTSLLTSLLKRAGRSTVPAS
jgi:hypothetical protein